ncbi:MAG TPA: hypothetical protein VMY69_04950 [Phycisphaerae bacterium]|nr:hypothetical protein [Phycisphaerae bacterium]
MTSMQTDSAFVRRLAAAARAGWWCLLVAVAVVILQSAVYLSVVRSGCFWPRMAGFMGTEAPTMHSVLLIFMMGMRVAVLAWLLGCLFLTLWVRRLRRIGDV